MLTKNINFKNYKLKKDNKKIKSDLKLFLIENNEILKSLKLNYKNNYTNKIIKKIQKIFEY